MNYKLINRSTNEETICTKVVVDGFDYYVSGEIPNPNDLAIYSNPNTPQKPHRVVRVIKTDKSDSYDYENPYLVIAYRPKIWFKKVIATNNPNIDLPKVIDEVEELANNFYPIDEDYKLKYKTDYKEYNNVWKEGYKKSQETHPNSDEDMALFLVWHNSFTQEKLEYITKQITFNKEINTKDLIEIWKSQQPKTLYYESNT